jgi:uncharacterized protein YecT (DUF1311 family)
MLDRDRIALCLSVILAAPCVAAAADCSAARSQAALSACAGAGAAQADKALNDEYLSLENSLSPNGRSRLRDAERAWVRFRDAECTLRSNGADGGSVAPMIAASCSEDLTRRRTSELAEYGTCAEGDLSCPR